MVDWVYDPASAAALLRHSTLLNCDAAAICKSSTISGMVTTFGPSH